MKKCECEFPWFSIKLWGNLITRATVFALYFKLLVQSLVGKMCEAFSVKLTHICVDGHTSVTICFNYALSSSLLCFECFVLLFITNSAELFLYSNATLVCFRYWTGTGPCCMLSIATLHAHIFLLVHPCGLPNCLCIPQVPHYYAYMCCMCEWLWWWTHRLSQLSVNICTGLLCIADADVRACITEGITVQYTNTVHRTVHNHTAQCVHAVFKDSSGMFIYLDP